MGLTNTIITKIYVQWFARKSIRFDKVLLDAPCSGTGTIRKSLKTLTIWNPTMIKRLAYTQKKLIDAAYQVLKQGGILVYSTCSVEPEENEGVISYLLENYDVQIQEIKLKINRSNPILEFDGEQYNPAVEKCLRIWPQDNDTEGFFVAKIKKS